MTFDDSFPCLRGDSGHCYYSKHTISARVAITRYPSSWLPKITKQSRHPKMPLQKNGTSILTSTFVTWYLIAIKRIRLLKQQRRQGRVTFIALASFVVTTEANGFILTLASNWSRMMNELRKNVVDPRCIMNPQIPVWSISSLQSGNLLSNSALYYRLHCILYSYKLTTNISTATLSVAQSNYLFLLFT